MFMSQTQTSWPLKKTQQLVYVELGAHNGGMVLGICEEGFSFRAVAPLKADGPVNFAFALDGNRRLQGTGELAWSEEDGKTGGGGGRQEKRPEEGPPPINRLSKLLGNFQNQSPLKQNLSKRSPLRQEPSR